jgi:gliding motility-associated-like protein
MLDLGSGFSSYKWSDGSSGHSIIPETSGLYWGEVSNIHKCIKRDSIRITLNPLPGFDLGPDKTICEGDSLIADVGDNFKNYSWSTGSNERLVYLKKTDKYYVTVQNNFNCTKTDSIALNFFPKTEITNIDTSINGQIIIEGNLINLPYQFSIDQNNYQDNNTFTHLKPGKYTITIKDIHNCLATGYIDIYTDLITIPNYFTPNADGYHDTWEIKGISSYPYAKIQIFDRFGKLLVSYLGKDRAWDGTSGSIHLKSDDYWYSIDLGEGAKPYIGNLSLKR